MYRHLIPVNLGTFVCRVYMINQFALVFSSQDLTCTASADYIGNLKLQAYLSVISRICWHGILGTPVSIYVYYRKHMLRKLPPALVSTRLSLCW